MVSENKANFSRERPFLHGILPNANKISNKLKDSTIVALFRNSVVDSLQNIRLFRYEDNKPFTYIVTGDIDAMWLRDSAYQVLPLLHLAPTDTDIKTMVLGVINQQTAFILRDPYANAHRLETSQSSPHRKDKTEMKPGIFERKWEPDSLSAAILLSHNFWKTTGDNSFAKDPQWQEAMFAIYDTFKNEQRLDGQTPYTFTRRSLSHTEKVVNNGSGSPTAKIGLIHGTHRPSDDATVYSFNIPSNFFAAISLRQLAEIQESVGNSEFAKKCRDFSDEIAKAIDQYAMTVHSEYGTIYAYEVDGLGNMLLMDDANLPGLLSLPYFGIKENETYQNTRRFVLSENNKYFVAGSLYEGIGSPHTKKDSIWPLSIIMRALTSNSDEEIKLCLRMLGQTHNGRGLLNESVAKNDPRQFTRERFGMANSMFVELILTLQSTKPHLL